MLTQRQRLCGSAYAPYWRNVEALADYALYGEGWPLVGGGGTGRGDRGWQMPICYQVADWKQDFGKGLADYTKGHIVRLAGHKKNIDLVVLPSRRPPPPEAATAFLERVKDELWREPLE